jgi:murein DD-endopeptidase MepM/ murein hydrolase activator NlpD
VRCLALMLFLNCAFCSPTENSALQISLPMRGLQLSDIHNTFDEVRGGTHRHDATDIMAARGTAVLAVNDGTIVKLFLSKPGGNTIYQFDPSNEYCYYYAHLDHYASSLAEGKLVHRGEVIGYVGSTGNANTQNPHLHFEIHRLDSEKRWYHGTPINPYPYLMAALKSAH